MHELFIKNLSAYNFSDDAVLLHSFTNMVLYHCHEILSSNMTHLGELV